jgi:hypothetical protein
MKEPIKKTIKEAGSGSSLSPAESSPITHLRDGLVVAEIKRYMMENLQDVELVKIIEDGDVYHMDFRFSIDKPNPQMQYTRETAKHRAYDIKRALEMDLMPMFNIPSFSISGVRTVPGPSPALAWCEFTIAFIYANKGNIKPHYESNERDQKVRRLVQEALKDALKPRIEEDEDPLKEALK